MILSGFFLLILVASLAAVVNWRIGLFAMVIVGLLQDPIRKVVPGTPGYLVMSTVPIWSAALARSLLSSRSRDRIAAHYPRLKKALILFLVSAIPAALISLTYGPGSWKMTALGTFMYGSALLPILLGYRFARRISDLRRFLGFYAGGVAAMCVGTLLEANGVALPVLGTEMLGFEWIRYVQDSLIHMVAGFFRSPDVMGWHAATATMIFLTLALSGRGVSRVPWVALATWCSFIAILCGRRKMVYMIPFFVLAVAWIPWQIKGRRRILSVIGIVVVCALGLALLYQQFQPDERFMTYYVDNPWDIYDQVERHGFRSLLVTIRQSGFFGAGLGSSATGVHHLSVSRPALWQESGPSKLLVELGVPGAAGFLYFVYAGVLASWRLLRERREQDRGIFMLCTGLFSVLVANAGSFVVSGQIFGDPFIACLAAFFAGSLLSFARLEPNAREARVAMHRDGAGSVHSGGSASPASVALAGRGPLP